MFNVLADGERLVGFEPTTPSLLDRCSDLIELQALVERRLTSER